MKTTVRAVRAVRDVKSWVGAGAGWIALVILREFVNLSDSANCVFLICKRLDSDISSMKQAMLKYFSGDEYSRRCVCRFFWHFQFYCYLLLGLFPDVS